MRWALFLGVVSCSMPPSPRPADPPSRARPATKHDDPVLVTGELRTWNGTPVPHGTIVLSTLEDATVTDSDARGRFAVLVYPNLSGVARARYEVGAAYPSDSNIERCCLGELGACPPDLRTTVDVSSGERMVHIAVQMKELQVVNGQLEVQPVPRRPTFEVPGTRNPKRIRCSVSSLEASTAADACPSTDSSGRCIGPFLLSALMLRPTPRPVRFKSAFCPAGAAAQEVVGRGLTGVVCVRGHRSPIAVGPAVGWWDSTGSIALRGEYVAGWPTGAWTINDGGGKQIARELWLTRTSTKSP